MKNRNYNLEEAPAIGGNIVFPPGTHNYRLLQESAVSDRSFSLLRQMREKPNADVHLVVCSPGYIEYTRQHPDRETIAIADRRSAKHLANCDMKAAALIGENGGFKSNLTPNKVSQ